MEPLKELSGKEKQVCGLLALGQRPKQVASTMGLSVFTIQSHIRNILAKLIQKLGEANPGQTRNYRITIIWRYAWDTGLVKPIFSGTSVLNEVGKRVAIELASGLFVKAVANKLRMSESAVRNNLMASQRKIKKLGAPQGNGTYVVIRYVCDLGLVKPLFSKET